MDDKQLRLECIKIAKEISSPNIRVEILIEEAQKIYAFLSTPS